MASLQAHVHSPLQFFLPSGPFTGLEDPRSSLPSTPLLVSYQVSWVPSPALRTAPPGTKEGHSCSDTCHVLDPPHAGLEAGSAHFTGGETDVLGDTMLSG